MFIGSSLCRHTRHNQSRFTTTLLSPLISCQQNTKILNHNVIIVPKSDSSFHSRKDSIIEYHNSYDVWCGKTFIKRGNLRIHKRKHHSQTLNEKSITSLGSTGDKTGSKCDICGKIISRKSNLKIHKKKRHNQTSNDETVTIIGDKKPFECDLCELAFSQKGNLKRHKRKLHSQNSGDKTNTSENFNDNKEYFKCEICDEKFTEEIELKLHQQTRHIKVSIGK